MIPFGRNGQVIVPIEGDTENVKVMGECLITGKEYSVTVSLESLMRWKDGELIQNAFPNMPKEDREFLISGTSPEGWKALDFDKEDDEEEFTGEEFDQVPADARIPQANGDDTLI